MNLAAVWIWIGVFFVACGLFTFAVGVAALVDAFAAVRVRVTTIDRRFGGYTLIRARVEAACGTIVAPYTGLPAVFSRTRIRASAPAGSEREERNWRAQHDEPNDLVGLWEERLPFVVADETGSMDVHANVAFRRLLRRDSEPLQRLPELLEDAVHRRYGNPAFLRPPGGSFHVTEESLLPNDCVWILVLSMNARDPKSRSIVCVSPAKASQQRRT